LIDRSLRLGTVFRPNARRSIPVIAIANTDIVGDDASGARLIRAHDERSQRAVDALQRTALLLLLLLLLIFGSRG
jgi:hypothetical protein